jgi:hypothetical protein
MVEEPTRMLKDGEFGQIPVPPPEPEPAKPSRFGRWVRRLATWAVGLIVVFLLGGAALYIWQVRPLSASLKQAQDQLQAQNAELADLRPLKAANTDLQNQLAAAQSRILLLQALVDVTGAQVALAQGHAQVAQQALSGTDGRLQQLGAAIGTSHASDVTALRDRLKLAMGELQSDAFAAGNDLEVLASNLANLDKDLSGP